MVLATMAGSTFASVPGPAVLVRGGGVAGGDALVIPGGDILNVRNIQGGTIADPNLDLGAGSASHRGTLALNYDVGRCVVIYDGHKHRLAEFCPHQIVFYVKPRVR
jgi:hypothetical protein